MWFHRNLEKGYSASNCPPCIRLTEEQKKVLVWPDIIRVTVSHIVTPIAKDTKSDPAVFGSVSSVFSDSDLA